MQMGFMCPVSQNVYPLFERCTENRLLCSLDECTFLFYFSYISYTPVTNFYRWSSTALFNVQEKNPKYGGMKMSPILQPLRALSMGLQLAYLHRGEVAFFRSGSFTAVVAATKL